MSDRDPVLVAFVVAPALLIVEIVAHEVVHAAIDTAATGTVASCGLGPWTYRAGRLVTCYGSSNVADWNNLLTPRLMVTAGILAMYYSVSIYRPGVRWGVLVAGAGVTLYESLYAAAIWGMPLVRPSGVSTAATESTPSRRSGPARCSPGWCCSRSGSGCWWDE